MKHVGCKEWLPLIHVHLVKVAAVNLRKLVLLPLESSQVSHAYVRSILWFGDLQPSFHMCSEHTKPLIDLFKEKKFLLKSIPYARILISSLMVPHLNSVVFYYKTTTWSCLSGTACSHVCSKTGSSFGAYYRSSFPENLATSSRRLVLQTFIFLPRLDESGISDTNQIWISGRYDGLEHFPRTIISFPRKPVKWMSWPTHPAGRPVIIISWLRKLATSP